MTPIEIAQYTLIAGVVLAAVIGFIIVIWKR